MARAAERDVVVMAAAVADYTVGRPDAAENREERWSADADAQRARATSSPTSGSCRRGASDDVPCSSGFAAETARRAVAHARRKLERKKRRPDRRQRCLAAGAGFDGDTNAVTLVSRDGAEEVPLQSKSAVASTHPRRVEQLLA